MIIFKNFIKDPFFHFLLVASFIYLIQVVFDAEQREKKNIFLSPQEIEQLRVTWKRDWKREPTDAEFNAVLAKRFQDKMLFEEALVLGLHREDKKIYSKLIDRTKQLFKNPQASFKPDETILRAYYSKHRNNYQKNGIFTFSHLFISIDHSNPIQKANEMLVLMQEADVQARDVHKYGDQTPSNHIKNATYQQIIQTFGKSFYTQLSSFKKGEWEGPVISNLGVHIVNIESHTDGNILKYEEIKDIVLSDYIKDTKMRYYQDKIVQMSDKYNLVKE